MKRYAITWGELTAIEPTLDEIAYHAGDALGRLQRADERRADGPHRADSRRRRDRRPTTRTIAAGMRAFLLFRRRRARRFAGDADLRGLRGGAAEFAFMIATPTAQGKGLGTRFAHDGPRVRRFTSSRSRASTRRSSRTTRRRGACSRSSATSSTTAPPRASTPTSPATSRSCSIARAFERTHAAVLAEIRIASAIAPWPLRRRCSPGSSPLCTSTSSCSRCSCGPRRSARRRSSARSTSMQQTKVLAANQGLYNGFLAAGLVWSFFATNRATTIRLFFLGCVVVAGLYGATDRVAQRSCSCKHCPRLPPSPVTLLGR